MDFVKSLSRQKSDQSWGVPGKGASRSRTSSGARFGIGVFGTQPCHSPFPEQKVSIEPGRHFRRVSGQRRGKII